MNATALETSSVPAALTSAGAELPRTFGRYTLFELIGKGGMAEIFLARAEMDLGATRLSVVKQILPSYADDPRFSEMLIHEAKLAARLNHRHIVQVFDLGRHDAHLFIAMEYVEGYDLNALLRRCSESKVGLPAAHALGIVADVLAALDYAHRRTDDDGVPLAIVHRDVSPSNVLISYDGEVKLCDFGIAHANDLVRDSAAEELKGKAGYMSPEHANGASLDARADVFAVGILAWELLAGRRLYRPRSEIPLLEQARAAEIPPIPDKGLPKHAALETIVRRALAKEPDQRYASAAAFARDLDVYIAEAGLLANRLKLGEWIAESFGTQIVEARRASERRLPKSTPPPPPRHSERVRVGSDRSPGASVPTAAPLPADLLPALDPEPTPTPSPWPAFASSRTPLAAAVSPDDLHSEGAMRAFKRELVVEPPDSLAGTAFEDETETETETDRRAIPDDAELPRSRRVSPVLVAAVALVTVAGLVALARILVH